MKKKTLFNRLLVTILAVSFAAIIFCVTAFALMLGSVSEDALKRSSLTNDLLIEIVMHGFSQGEGELTAFVLEHSKLLMEGKSFDSDRALVEYAAQEVIRVTGLGVMAEHLLFTARSGEVTAAVKVKYDASLGVNVISEVESDEATRTLEQSNLAAEDFEGRTLAEILNVEDYSGAYYNLQDENIPLWFIVSISKNHSIGIFYPQAASLRNFTTLKEVAENAQTETADVIRGSVERYVLLLVAVGCALMFFTLLLARKLSRSISEPVEQEKEMLEQINKLKTEFLADISHELKTPLTVMSSHAQHGQKALRDIPEAEDAEREMRLIASEADRLALMVSQVLDMTQIEEGRMALHIQPASVMEIIQRTLDTYYPMFRKNNNTLRVEPGSPSLALCDGPRIMQVLVNLVSNAAAHTRDGEITVSTAREDTHIRISVADTGDGIPPGQMKTLFERYYAKRANGTGTGLGLPISKYIVEAHGGKLDIKSSVGEGTTASFTLPSAQEQ